MRHYNIYSNYVDHIINNVQIRYKNNIANRAKIIAIFNVIMCYMINIKAYIKQSLHKTELKYYFFTQLALLLLKAIFVETLIKQNENIIFIYDNFNYFNYLIIT